MAGRYPPAQPHTTYRMPLLASLCYPAAVLRSPSPLLPWQQLSEDVVPVAADAPLDLSVRSGLGETEGMREGLASRRADHIEGGEWYEVGEAADRQSQQHQEQMLLEPLDDQPLDLTVSAATRATAHYRPPVRTATSRHGTSPACIPSPAFAAPEGFAATALVPDDSHRLPPAAARVGRAVEAYCDSLPRRPPVRDGAVLSHSERDSRRSPASGSALGRLTCFAVSEASDRPSDGVSPAATSVNPDSWPCGGSPWPPHQASVVQRPFLRTADRFALPYASSAAPSNPSSRGVVRHSSGKLDLELLGLRPSHTANDVLSAWPAASLILPVAQEATLSAARQSTSGSHWETKRNVKRLATVLPQQGVSDRRRKQPRPAEVARLPLDRPASPVSYRSIVDAAQLVPQPRACASLGSFKDGDRLPLPPAAAAQGPDSRRYSDPNYFFASPMAADRRNASAPPASGIPSTAAAAATAASAESVPAHPPLNATSHGVKTEAQSYQQQAGRSQSAKRKSSLERLSEASRKSACNFVNRPIKQSKEFAFDRNELASLGGDGGGSGGSDRANGKLSLARYMEAAAARVFLREKFNPPTDVRALLLLQWPQGDRQDSPEAERNTLSPTAVADNLIGMLHQAVERGVRQQSVSPGPTLDGSPSEVTMPVAASSQPLSLVACVPAAEAVEAANSVLASEPVSAVLSVPKEEQFCPAADKSLLITEKLITVAEKVVAISEPASLALSAAREGSQPPSAPSASHQRVTKNASQQALPSCDMCSSALEKQLLPNLASASSAIGSVSPATVEVAPGPIRLKDHIAAPRKSSVSFEMDLQSASEHIGGSADRRPASQDICSAASARGLEKSSRVIAKPNAAASSSSPSPPSQSAHGAGCSSGSDPGKPFISNRSTVRQHSPSKGSAVQSKIRSEQMQGTTDKSPSENRGHGRALLVGSCGLDHTDAENVLHDGCSAVGCPPSSSSVGRQLSPASQGCGIAGASPAVGPDVKSAELKDAAPLGEAVTVAVSAECTAKCSFDADKQTSSGAASNDAGGSSEKWASMTNSEGRLVLVKVKYCCSHRLLNGEASATMELVDGGRAEQQVANGAAEVSMPADCR